MPFRRTRSSLFLQGFHRQLEFSEAKLFLDRVCRSHIAVAYVSVVSPCSSQPHAGIDPACAGGHRDGRERRRHSLLEGEKQVGQKGMPPQSGSPIWQGVGGREFDVEANLQQITKFFFGFFLADFLVVLLAVEKSQGNFLRIARAEDQRQHASRNVFSLVSKGIQIRE